MQWLFGMSLLPGVCRYLDDPEGASAVYARLQPFGRLNATCPRAVPRVGVTSPRDPRRDDGPLVGAVEHLELALRMDAEMAARPWFAHAQYDYALALLRRGTPATAGRQRSC